MIAFPVYLRLILLCSACGGWAAPAGAQATLHQDGAHHFAMEIPEGWVLMPPEALRLVNQQLKERMPGMDLWYVAGLQRAGSLPLVHPYVLVQVEARDLSNVSHEELEQSLGENVKPVERDVEHALSDLAANVDIGQVALERGRNRFVVPLHLDVAGVGEVRGISVGMLGREAIIAIHCYARASEFADWTPVFEQITDGFGFDPGYAFEARSAHPVRDSALRGGLIGAMAAGLYSIIVVVLRNRRRNRASGAAEGPAD